MSGINLELRVSVLEEKLMWSEDTIKRMDRKIDSLQTGQLHMLEKISDLQAHTDWSISDLRSHTDQKISALQAHTDNRFLELGREFNRVHAELSGVHGQIAGVHSSIAMQTKWILSVILFASVVGPVVLKLLDRYL